jgi:hypothetical protein
MNRLDGGGHFMRLSEETNRIEYKQELTDDLEREVVTFLNYSEGGEIYIGIDKNRNVLGVEDIDLTQRKIVVPSGIEKPYYLRSKGMAPVGCFIRVGSSVQPMTTAQIDALSIESLKNCVSRIKPLLRLLLSHGLSAVWLMKPRCGRFW